MATQREIELQAQVDALKGQLEQRGRLTVKVSEKGAVSVYGLSARFPVTLYASQWERLAGFMPTIAAFIEENRGSLSFKTASASTPAAPTTPAPNSEAAKAALKAQLRSNPNTRPSA